MIPLAPLNAAHMNTINHETSLRLFLKGPWIHIFSISFWLCAERCCVHRHFYAFRCELEDIFIYKNLYLCLREFETDFKRLSCKKVTQSQHHGVVRHVAIFKQKWWSYYVSIVVCLNLSIFFIFLVWICGVTVIKAECNKTISLQSQRNLLALLFFLNATLIFDYFNYSNDGTGQIFKFESSF